MCHEKSYEVHEDESVSVYGCRGIRDSQGRRLKQERLSVAYNFTRGFDIRLTKNNVIESKASAVFEDVPLLRRHSHQYCTAPPKYGAWSACLPS